MSANQKMKVAVVKALAAAGLHIVDGQGRANKEVLHAILALIGSDVMPADVAIRPWLSAKLRDMAGDIDDGFVLGAQIKHPVTFCWVLETLKDDRVIDDGDAIAAIQEIQKLPSPGPEYVLVRRWRKAFS